MQSFCTKKITIRNCGFFLTSYLWNGRFITYKICVRWDIPCLRPCPETAVKGHTTAFTATESILRSYYLFSYYEVTQMLYKPKFNCRVYNTLLQDTTINTTCIIRACRSQWPRGLRCKSAVARLLRLWVRIPPGSWMFLCCECRVLSGRGLCDELIIRPEESYRLCCVVVCDLETSRMGAPYIYI